MVRRKLRDRFSRSKKAPAEATGANTTAEGTSSPVEDEGERNATANEALALETSVPVPLHINHWIARAESVEIGTPFGNQVDEPPQPVPSAPGKDFSGSN
jgi:hypothetical protein